MNPSEFSGSTEGGHSAVAASDAPRHRPAPHRAGALRVSDPRVRRRSAQNAGPGAPGLAWLVSAGQRETLQGALSRTTAVLAFAGERAGEQFPLAKNLSMADRGGGRGGRLMEHFLWQCGRRLRNRMRRRSCGPRCRKEIADRADLSPWCSQCDRESSGEASRRKCGTQTRRNIRSKKRAGERNLY